MTPAPAARAARGGRWLGGCLFLAGWGAVYGGALRALAGLAVRSDPYSHALVVPLVSAFLLFQERRTIARLAQPSPGAGLALLALGAVPYVLIALPAPSPAAPGALTWAILSAWLTLLAGFLLLFGARAFGAALFPLGFLGFAVPLPESLLETTVSFLQHGSAAITEVFFRLTGTTFLRDGLTFHLPRVSVSIAPECSSIRSSLALVITATLAAWLFLRRWWGRAALVLVSVPLSLVKNAIRIATLTLLAQYVDLRFLTGHWLHNSGGFLFFLVTLALLGAFLSLLRRAEGRAHAAGGPAGRGGRGSVRAAGEEER